MKTPKEIHAELTKLQKQMFSLCEEILDLIENDDPEKRQHIIATWEEFMEDIDNLQIPVDKF